MPKKLDPTQTGGPADRLRIDLERNVIGQPEAIQRVVETYQTFLAGLSGQGRPLGNMLFLGATGTGKALSVDARVLAKDGWTTMGALRVGDEVRTPANKLAVISGVFPQGDLQLYRIMFADGRSTECCNDHLWRVSKRRSIVYSVMSLAQIRQHMATHTPQNGVFVELPSALDIVTNPADLPMPAYDLGVFLGGGTAAMVDWTPVLHRLGLAAEDCPVAARFIPEAYRQAPVQDRADLVHGMMRGDSFTTASLRLAEDLQDVLRSLGAGARITAVGGGAETEAGTIFRVKRSWSRNGLRIVSIEPTRVAPAQCISLQDDNHLYITDEFIVTHNTKLVESVAQSLAGDPKALLKIDCGEFQHSHEIAKLIGCFVPGTKVLMADGDGKSIEDVKKGDMILAGDGVPRPVLDTYIYQSDGEMVQIDIASNNIPLIATPDHKILAIRNPTEPGKRVRDPKSLYRPDKLEWVSAKDLRKKDIVVYPRYKGEIIEPPVIDLADYARALINPVIEDEWVIPRGTIATRIKRFIKVDENFARLAGYYVAEGGANREATNSASLGISFTMGIPQKQEALDNIRLLVPLVFGEDCRVSEDTSRPHALRLYVHSMILGPFMEDLFGAYTLTKKIPAFFLQLPEDILWNFVDAAIMGDGGCTVPRRVDYSTSSEQLHHQINTILRSRLGITTQVQWHKSTRAGWADRYRTYIAGAQIDRFAKSLPFSGKKIDLSGARYAEGIQRGSHVDDNYVYFQLTTVKPIQYTGPVHDISVSHNPPEQQYVAGGVDVSNSPPGYLGHRETHPLLSQEALNQYHTDQMKISFLLFDEIEKASNALWHLLLGILDKATLTLGDNRRVDFSRAIIFMTSNLGAAEMNRVINPGLGFALPADLDAKSTAEKLSRTGTDSARRNFTPEFMNRLDAVVVFRNLGAAEIDRIFDLEIAAVQNRIFKQCNNAPFVLRVAAGARQSLLQQSFDVRYGARHLKRTIERMLVTPLSNLISSGQIRGGDLIEVDIEDGVAALAFHCVDENMTALAMLKEMNQLADGAAMNGGGGGAGDYSVPRKMAEPRRNVIPYVKRPPTRISRQRAAGPVKPPIQ